MSVLSFAIALLLATSASVSASSNSSDDNPVPRRPKHMRRKAAFHRTKANQDHKLIKKILERIERNQRDTDRGRNRAYWCNNDEEKTLRDDYACSNMNQLYFISNAELGSRAATDFTQGCVADAADGLGFDFINEVWGYESEVSGRKYAMAGMWDGTSFVDITDERRPVVLGFIEMEGDLEPGNCDDGFWRDVKIMNDHVYIVGEAINSGIQVFDLSRLDSLPRPDSTEPVTRGDVPRLEADAHVTSIGHSHNLIEFPELNQLLVVGFGIDDKATACNWKDGESVAIFDVSEDPLNPSVECLELGDLLNKRNQLPYALMHTYPGYVHDGQCFIYDGPDEKYRNIPMCIFFAETEIGIYDMDNREMISTFSYEGATYVHQGWISSDFTTLYANDECDEECQSGGLYCFQLDNDSAQPNTRIFDITSLEDVPAPREFINDAPHPSIDHNMYVKDDYIYSANYEAGARVYKILEDKSLEEVAYFDVSNDCDDIINCDDPYAGTWTHFPYSDDTTIASNGFYGLHVFRVNLDDNVAAVETERKTTESKVKQMDEEDLEIHD